MSRNSLIGIGVFGLLIVLVVGGLFLYRQRTIKAVQQRRAAMAHTAHTPTGQGATVKYARGFTLEYHQGYKLVRVLSPWRDAKTTFTYVLVPRGGKAPSTVVPDALVVETPVRRAIVTSTTCVPYFAMLGIEDAIAGMTGTGQVGTPSVAARIKRKAIIEVGTGSGMAKGFDMERLLALQPDLIMTYGTGDPQYDHHAKLAEAGFRVAINGEYMETTPLGRTEWMKFIAAFFDKDADAERTFADIARRYDAEAEKARAANTRPTVFTGMDYQGTWHMPGGNSYVAAFLRDAGAEYLWNDDQSTGSMPLTTEAVIARAKDADFWLNPAMCRSLAELAGADERYTVFRAFRSGQVYNDNATIGPGGGNDYWETGIANPDRVLADLISIFHPEVLPAHQRTWYQQLPEKAQGAR